jgi:glycosyltransferase involved in cell wall biosynthesis
VRIAYVAPYQGPQLLQRRPVVGNLALAGNLKIELIAGLLARRGHDVEIISQGEVLNRPRFYPGFQETTTGDRAVPVFYSSALPIRFVNGYWSGRGVLSILKNRHRDKQFDAVIVYNLNVPQVRAGLYAADKLHLPVIVEFEDDSFVDILGQPLKVGVKAKWQRGRQLALLNKAKGAICVSPHLQTRFEANKPMLLLRDVISDEVISHARQSNASRRKNIVAFSGTFARSKGLVPLIEGWKSANLSNWELHLAGDGAIAGDLRRRAEGTSSIKFRGLLSRNENAAFLAESRIGINPHDLSATPGNVFAFKIIEYLAAGLHVISTPMGPLEAELETGITYIQDNSASSVAKGLSDVIRGEHYSQLATDAAVQRYGGDAVAVALDGLLSRAVRSDIEVSKMSTYRPGLDPSAKWD